MTYPTPDIGAAPTPEGAYGATTTAAEGAALPQFDTSVWAGQIVYLLVLFFILYLLISRVFAPRLRRVIDERAATISTAVATARSVQVEAEGQAEAAKAEVATARASARAQAVAARARITEAAQARMADQERELDGRIGQAETEIARTRDAAMTSVGAVASDTAAAMVERLTGKAPARAELKGA